MFALQLCFLIIAMLFLHSTAATIDVSSMSLSNLLGIKGFNEFHAERSEGRQLLAYTNPNDKYKPTSNVENGHKLSGEAFDTTPAYLTAVLSSPIALCVTGFVSLFMLNLMLCCRKCFKCLRCDPNDHHNEKGHEHDSATKRAAYINHQKLMVFIVEMVLCGCVMLADMLCFYGYSYIVSGGNDLLDALELIRLILQGGSDGAAAVVSGAVGMTVAINGAKVTTCQASNAPDSSIEAAIDTAYDTLSGASTGVQTAMETVEGSLGDLLSYVEDGKVYVADYLIGYADIFVFLIWSFAFVSVILFVLFRFCRSQIGTKFAILWGQVTFIIMILVCLPFMIFSSLMGDFCMNPSYSAVINSPDSIRDMIQQYATCVGTGEVETQMTNGLIDATSMGTTINNSFKDFCGNEQYLFGTSDANPFYVSGNGANGPNSIGNTMVHITGVITSLGNVNAPASVLGGVSGMLEAASCEKIQAVWFKIMNDALCTNFYSGIYSLWVSQFITSFFLFFLIVVASISYHYFAKTAIYVEPDEGAATEKKSEVHKDPYPHASDVEMVPMVAEVADVPVDNDIEKE